MVKSRQYQLLVQDIGSLLNCARSDAFYAVNKILVKTYWKIGKLVVEYEQKGREKAEYGTGLLDKLSWDLKKRHGKGFSRRNVCNMRKFYLIYPIWQTVSAKLSWSHYIELLGISTDLAREFYEKQCINEGWSVRALKRQTNSMLFERIVLNKGKKKVSELAEKGQVIKNEGDVVKDPYVLEFLGIPQSCKYSERELEQKIIDNLQMFLLEFGNGFAFVKRQFRITLDNVHFYVDLVFYHMHLGCFVLVDLKVGKANHLDVGQMNMYLNYFKQEESGENDSPPVGIGGYHSYLG